MRKTGKDLVHIRAQKSMNDRMLRVTVTPAHACATLWAPAEGIAGMRLGFGGPKGPGPIEPELAVGSIFLTLCPEETCLAEKKQCDEELADLVATRAAGFLCYITTWNKSLVWGIHGHIREHELR